MFKISERAESLAIRFYNIYKVNRFFQKRKP